MNSTTNTTADFIDNRTWRTAVMISLSIAAGLAAGAVVTFAAGYSPASVYAMMFQGAFVGPESLLNTLQRATPLIFTGLAVLVSFRTGTFNLGVEGQLHIGAITAAWAGFAIKGLGPVVHPAAAILIAMAAGAVYALIPALLKVWLGVNEVLTTIMMNTVAVLFAQYLVNYPLRASPMAPMTPPVARTAELAQFAPCSQANVGLFIALALAVSVWFLFSRTTLGYRMRMVGAAAPFAEYVGIGVARTAVLGMVMSGAIGALAGAVEVLGVHRRYVDPFSAGLGFDGILVAWLGKGSPIGVVLAALFYGGLKNGAMTVDLFTDIPRELANTILAIIIFFAAAEGLFDFLWSRRRARRKVR